MIASLRVALDHDALDVCAMLDAMRMYEVGDRRLLLSLWSSAGHPPAALSSECDTHTRAIRCGQMCVAMIK